MGKREAKRNATDYDVRRMYIRGRDRTLKIEAVPLEEALERAKVSPPRKPARVKPLGKQQKQIDVKPPSSVLKLQVSTPKQRKPWSVGSARSRSVLRPNLPPKPKKTDHSIDKGKSFRSEPNAVSRSLSKSKKTKLKPKKTKKSRLSVWPFEGQPRFEGGIRFVQGGLPELGKR